MTPAHRRGVWVICSLPSDVRGEGRQAQRKLWCYLKVLKNIVGKFQKSDAFALKQLLESRRQECLEVEDPGHIYSSDFHSHQRTSGKPKADGS